jgi:hypothetical protein
VLTPHLPGNAKWSDVVTVDKRRSRCYQRWFLCGEKRQELSDMMGRSVTLLAKQMDDVWSALYGWTDGLIDQEYFWKPVRACWTVHIDEKGNWVVDYEKPPPDPTPFTTIAWKMEHITSCKIMYREYAFGEGKLRWEDIPVARTAAESISRLSEAQTRLRTELDNIHNEELELMRRTNWGDKWPTWRIFWTMISHDLHHGAEIGCLRDLYRVMNASEDITRYST